MSIRHAILGLLSWKPLSGYDLKKIVANSPAQYWSGNNNQIYTGLVQLHKEGLVEYLVETQASLPAKKIYSLTPAGQAELRAWVMSAPEPPELRSAFLVQLSWADLLTPDDLDNLLSRYEEEVSVLLVTQRELARRASPPNRTARETYLWQRIDAYFVSAYEHELTWIRDTRKGVEHFRS